MDVEYAPGDPDPALGHTLLPDRRGRAARSLGRDRLPVPRCRARPAIPGQWRDATENPTNVAWVRSCWKALHEFSEPGGYNNFQDADDQSRIEENLAANYARLAQVKSK